MDDFYITELKLETEQISYGYDFDRSLWCVLSSMVLMFLPSLLAVNGLTMAVRRVVLLTYAWNSRPSISSTKSYMKLTLAISTYI